MKWTMILLFVGAVCSILWVWQMDNHSTKVAHMRLKDSLDRATHDAALQVDKNILASNGAIVFTGNARSVLEATLQKNLNFDTNHYPTANNLFRSSDQLQVLVFDKLETGCSAGNVGFPCTYINTNYGYVDTIKGPSIIAIISMRHPRSFGVSLDKDFIVGSSHEYIPY